MNCQAVQESLTEYITGRHVADRDRIAGHLSHCEACDSARRDLEAVFALLQSAPEPPEPSHGEAIARLALRTAFAPGPLRGNEWSRRREDLRLGICSAVSFAGTVLLAVGAVIVRRQPPGWTLDLGQRFDAVRQGMVGMDVTALLKGGSLWQWALLFLGLGGLAAILPALILSGPPASGGRRARKEV